MTTQNKKISMRQAMIIYVVACLSPATRLFPAMGAHYGNHAVWVGIILAAAAAAALASVFAALFRAGDDGPQNFSEILDNVYGRPLGKIILLCYTVWVALLYIVYLRYYAERLISTIFTTTDVRFFIVAILLLVVVALRGRFEVFARFSEIALMIFTVVLVVLFLCLIPTFKPQNVWPVTPMDAKPILRSTLPVVSIFAYLALPFFLGEHIVGKDEIARHGRRAAIFLGTFVTIGTIVCLGTLSYRVAQRMPLPLFSTTKIVAVNQPLDRMEALLLSEWVISDFVIITAFGFALMNMLKRLTGARQARNFAVPVVFFGLVGAVHFVASRFELDAFSGNVTALSVNLALGFAVPILTLIVGKLRRKL